MSSCRKGEGESQNAKIASKRIGKKGVYEKADFRYEPVVVRGELARSSSSKDNDAGVPTTSSLAGGCCLSGAVFVPANHWATAPWEALNRGSHSGPCLTAMGPDSLSRFEACEASTITSTVGQFFGRPVDCYELLLRRLLAKSQFRNHVFSRCLTILISSHMLVTLNRLQCP